MMKVLKSHYFFWTLGVAVFFAATWFRIQNERKAVEEVDTSHYVSIRQDQRCFGKRCFIENKQEFFDLLVVPAGEAVKAKSLSFEGAIDFPEEKGKIYISFEYKNQEGRKIGGGGNPLFLKKGRQTIMKTFELNQGMLSHAKSLVVYFWNPSGFEFELSSANLSLKTDMKERWHKDISLSVEDLFGVKKAKKYVNLLDASNIDAECVNIKVLNYDQTKDKPGVRLVEEVRDGSGQMVTYNQYPLTSGVPINAFAFQGVKSNSEKGLSQKVYLTSDDKVIASTIGEIKLSLYR